MSMFLCASQMKESARSRPRRRFRTWGKGARPRRGRRPRETRARALRRKRRQVEVVETSRGRGTGVGHDGDRPAAAVARPRRKPGRGFAGGMETLVDGHRNGRVIAAAHDGAGPPDAVVGGFRNEDGHRASAPTPFAQTFDSDDGLPGREQGGQVADRPAVRENAVRALLPSGQARHPVDEVPFHDGVDRAHLVDRRGVVEELATRPASAASGRAVVHWWPTKRGWRRLFDRAKISGSSSGKGTAGSLPKRSAQEASIVSGSS